MRGRAGILIKTAPAIAALGLVLALGACGSSAPPPAAPVHLSQLLPADGSRVATGTITVSGTVTPHRARVLVMGRRVATGTDGRFSTSVPLRTGTNLIDVIAGAANARPAMTALRVVRYVLVSIPRVEGQSPTAAAATIKSAGLTPKLEGDGNPFSFLVPLSQRVCSQTPSAGERVTPGTIVTLEVGKVCL